MSNGRTWTLITYLADHPDVLVKFFSDSRTKTRQYAVLAETIFSKEPTQADGFKANPQPLSRRVFAGELSTCEQLL